MPRYFFDPLVRVRLAAASRCLETKTLSGAWLMASVFTALTAIVFGVWRNMRGTVARLLFDIVGPLLCLSTAILLVEFFNENVTVKTKT
jgi:hypothetical protein